MKKAIIVGVFVVLAVVIAGAILSTVITLVLQTNPPVVQEPTWDSPQTRLLAVRACFDCHSNETRWPWYTRLPVASWLAVSDTLEGREHLNFSDWGTGEHSLDEIADEINETVREGEMPPGMYLMMHPEAVLTDAEKQQLIAGLQRTIGK